MEFSGEYTINAPRQKVWDALNDPEILGQAIPGCQSIEKTSDTEMAATVKSKIGPVQATFKGKVTLSDLDPPNGYTITGEGQGGVAGFAKGGAQVHLKDAADGGTILNYEATGQVGGKIAQVGSRLVEGTAKKLADQFFGAFDGLVGEAPAAPEAAAEAPAPAPEAPRPAAAPAPASMMNRWIAAAVVAVIVVIVLIVLFD
jgi:hypothetical protein